MEEREKRKRNIEEKREKKEKNMEGKSEVWKEKNEI